MAKTFTTLRNLYGSLTEDTSTANLTLGDQLINDRILQIRTRRAWDFTEVTSTITTVASQQAYQLPVDYRKMRTVKSTVGSNTVVLRQAPNKAFFDTLNQSATTSTTLSWFFIIGSQIQFFPTPSASANTVTITYSTQTIDLSQADTVSGNILTATNGSTAIVGTGTTFTAGMVGQYLQIASITGDNRWYEIAAFTDTTNIALTKEYAGTSIAAGSASYIIGQLPQLPENYHVLPVYGAVSDYYLKTDKSGRGDRYLQKYNERITELIQDHASKTDEYVIEGREPLQENPNLYVTQ